jgi:hypothetical protein
MCPRGNLRKKKRWLVVARGCECAAFKRKKEVVIAKN